MKAVIALGLVCFTASAVADTAQSLQSLADNLEGEWVLKEGIWWPTSGSLKPPRCQVVLDELAAAKVPDTTTFELKRDVRDLKVGKHTIAEAKPACVQIAYMQKVKAFRDELAMAINFEDLEMAKRCIDTYDAVIKAGVKPTEVIPNAKVSKKRGEVDVGGSIESMRIKYCDPLYKQEADDKAKREAPYRAVLKGEKLEAALSGRFWMLAGKVDGANDPKKLAAANVWFYEMEPADGSSNCAGKTVTLYRWQFDPKTSKVIKATEKAFCGDPPASAYR